jgi:hypothetical protein
MPLLAAVILITFSLQDQPRADCREWHECRQLALDAAAADEYERFHDLAWRAVQTGPRNDPALMLLLARAQSLSGRPGDALVMLQRLAAMGVTTDATTNPDFRRVRNLPGWADFAAAGAGKDAPATAERSRATRTEAEPKVSTADKGNAPDKATRSDSADRKVSGARLPEADLKVSTAPEAADAAETAGAIRFETLPFNPAGLAYDAVSRRFIIADRRARRLAVIDEFSRHVANLASAQSAGFGDIAAIEIDPRQGDLWVVSGEGGRATLHKLQLISGRALASFVPSDRFGDVEFVDVAATPDNGVLVLDRTGHRVFHLRPKSAALELSFTLPDDPPSTIAPAGDEIVYVAHAAGISRVDLSARSTAELKSGKRLDLHNIRKLRWYKGALLAVQGSNDAGYRAVRIELDRQGRGVAAIHALDASLSPVDPTALTVTGGALYYLAAADDARMTIRKLPLK